MISRVIDVSISVRDYCDTLELYLYAILSEIIPVKVLEIIVP